jgi:hypothetical protein
MDTQNIIIDNLSDTHELERLYRENPETFRESFEAAWEKFPDSEVLAVWNERLYFKETRKVEKSSRIPKDFIFMGILAILAGASTRILMYFIDQEAISPVNLIFGQLPFIAAYFVYHNKSRKKILYTLGSLFVVTVIYMNALPLEQSDSIILAYLHLPVFLWVLAGFAFTGNEFEEGSSRLAFLKFNGEFAILYAAMAISGILLSVLTMQLFSFVGMDISEFYFENVVLFGAAALSIVASYLITKNLRLARNIAPYIARIFSPLVLVTLFAYLITVVMVGKNPFLDRDFLLSFNGILLLVLVVTIFSITESGRNEKKSISDYINLALIALALVIDGVALSAIIFRLSSYGITPNRIAVLGVNLLICANLIWIMFTYVKFLKDKTGPSAIQGAVTRYLPVYGLWAAFVTFTFPVIFG